MHGSLEAVDFDGEADGGARSRARWRNMFTPTMHFFRDEVPDGVTAEAAVVTMPGAFEVDQPSELGQEGFEEDHTTRARTNAGGKCLLKSYAQMCCCNHGV
jgi:hypothetical protein